MSTIHVGCAPISWTNDDMPTLGGDTPYQQILSEVALAGFEGTEIGAKYPKDPQVLLSELKLRGIRIGASWHGLFLTTKDYDEVERGFIDYCDYLVTLGADCVNVCEQGHSVQGRRDIGVFEGKPTFTDEEWDRLCSGLNKLGAIAKEKGLRVAYHHHMGTGVQTTPEIDRLMAHTDPELITLLIDVGHLKFSGEDPTAVINAYADRVGHVHLKDIRPEIVEKAKTENLSFLDAILAGVFTMPGDGPTDFAPLLNPIIDAGYEGWFMVEAEQDPAVANPLEYAQIARSYLRNTFNL